MWNKNLKMLIDEFRVSFRGAKNKNFAVLAFAAVVTKALYVNGVGFPVFWLTAISNENVSFR